MTKTAGAGIERELTVVYDADADSRTIGEEFEVWETEVRYRQRLRESLPKDEKQADAAEWLERYG
ncbi:MAG: hypothetical protein AB7F88_19795 [Pyrinomonadaceae bacterium]